jgi:serine/threonine protein kinase
MNDNVIGTDTLTLDSFRWIKLLAGIKGGYVACFKHRDSDNYYAIKVYSKWYLKRQEGDNVQQRILTERQILSENNSYESPHLVKLRYAFATKINLYLVTDYFTGGSLLEHIRHYQLTEAQKYLCICEIYQAIYHLHSRDIIHRDIKLENILVNAEGHVFVTDFGYSKTGVTQPDSGASTNLGTEGYKAPEIITGGEYGKAVDWWSFGVTVYMLCTLCRLRITPDGQWENTLQRKLTEKDIQIESVPHTLLTHLLVVNPVQRCKNVQNWRCKDYPFLSPLLTNGRFPLQPQQLSEVPCEPHFDAQSFFNNVEGPSDKFWDVKQWNWAETKPAGPSDNFWDDKQWDWPETTTASGGRIKLRPPVRSCHVKTTKRTKSRRTSPRKTVATNTNLVY